MAIDNIADWKDNNDNISIKNCIDVAADLVSRPDAVDLLIKEKLFAHDLIDAMGDLFDLAAHAVAKEQENDKATERRRRLDDQER